MVKTSFANGRLWGGGKGPSISGVLLAALRRWLGKGTESDTTAPSLAYHSDVAVLFVHGVGSQDEGDSLVQFGDPFVGFVSDWVLARHGSAAVEESVHSGPAHSRLTISNCRGERRVLVAESWWAEAFKGPSGTTAAWFILGLAPSVVGRVWAIACAHLRRIVAPQAPVAPGGSDPAIRPPFSRGAALLINVVLSVVAFIVGVVLGAAALVAMVVVIVALVVGQFLPPVRDPATKLLAILAGSVGDSWSLVRSDIRASEMVTKVSEDIQWAVGQADHVVVVAHSQGSAIVLASLTEHWHDKVRVVVTIGSAINLLDRRRRGHSLPGRIAGRVDQRPEADSHGATDAIVDLLTSRPCLEWLDFYTAFDAVPIGPLFDDPPARLTEHAVVNAASVLRDHPSYFSNTEQVIAPIALKALEISGFPLATPGDKAAIRDAGLRRSGRGVVLLGAKFVAILMAAVLAIDARDGGWAPWLAKTLAPIAKPQSELLSIWFGDSSTTAIGVSYWVGAGLVGVGALGILRLAWERWNTTAFHRLVRRKAASRSRDSIWFRLTLGLFGTALIALINLRLTDVAVIQSSIAIVMATVLTAALAVGLALPTPKPWEVGVRATAAPPDATDSRRRPRRPLDAFGQRVFGS